MTLEKKAVVFDFGGVIFRTSATEMYREIFEEHNKSGELEFFLQNIFTKKARSAANIGNMRDVTNALAEQHPHWAPFIREFEADHNFLQQVREVLPNMEETIQEIADKGYKIYGLTNWAADTFQALKTAYQPITGLFNDIVVSGEEGIKKPDPGIFKRAHARFNLAGHDVYYFDDKESNVAAARQAVGWNGIVFKDATTVRDALKL
ncbi:MAG: HAD-IA family hydrolase [Alphaproteobacteria bacterium]|nr:HAD-IA family hydrolase [Alphaproteobacteria bacterium]